MHEQNPAERLEGRNKFGLRTKKETEYFEVDLAGTCSKNREKEQFLIQKLFLYLWLAFLDLKEISGSSTLRDQKILSQIPRKTTTFFRVSTILEGNRRNVEN